MPGYISEIDYFGQDPDEFIEVAVPAGTDVSGYSLEVYDSSGALIYTFTSDAVQNTIAGQGTYVIDSSNPSFNSGGDAMGLFYPDDALALVDDSNYVLQLISWEGNTVTPVEGAANGMTSTNIGALVGNGSLQSDDGGASYFQQSSPTKGTIPCFAKGTMILCEDGEVAVEDLKPGMMVCTKAHGAEPLRWLWSGAQAPGAGRPEGRAHSTAGGLFGA